MSQNDKIYDVNKSKYNKECLRMTRFMMLIKDKNDKSKYNKECLRMTRFMMLIKVNIIKNVLE